MRSPENYVARELMPEFATWAEMRRALEIARQAIDAAAVYAQQAEWPSENGYAA